MGAAAPPVEASLVLIGRVGGRRVVLATDGVALSVGLRVGMPVTKAQALVPGLIVMDADPAADAEALDLAADASSGGATGYKLSPSAQGDKGATPFWVVQATPDVINGHNDIFNLRFLAFIAGLVFTHADHTADRDANPEFQRNALTPPSVMSRKDFPHHRAYVSLRLCWPKDSTPGLLMALPRR